MPNFRKIAASSEEREIEKKRCAGLDTLLLKLGVLNLVVGAAIYGAAAQGEAGSVFEFLLPPLAAVSAVALLATFVRRVRRS